VSASVSVSVSEREGEGEGEREAKSTDRPGEDPRRRRLLEAALTVFLRFGFRKTSMDEVARAANVSRQGLYFHFATKEELFRASVEHFLHTGLAATAAALADPDLPLEKRLVAAFDAWAGRFVGALGPNAADLATAVNEQVGPMIAESEEQFVEAISKALRASGLSAAYKPAGVTGRQLADTLYASAHGLKHRAETREAFIEGMTIAVRAMCLPLQEGREERPTQKPASRRSEGSRPRKARDKTR
jgi:AcrR family transcriptional regulator